MRNLRAICVAALAFAAAAGAYCQAWSVMEDRSNSAMDVYSPIGDAKFPVVFFVHNGGADKQGWSDYPRSLAEKGYLTASIGWTSMGGYDDLRDSIGSVMRKYSARIDPSRVALIGGCHGCVKMITMLKSADSPCAAKTVVLLSLSEMSTLPEDHVPVLGIYATEDHLGAYYKDFTKKYVETILTEPKRTFAFAGSPHGNELVADASSKEAVRGEIDKWLADKL